MSKEEFYKKYIESEDEKMLNIIHENARKHLDDKIIEKNDNVRKNRVFVCLVMFLVLVAIVIGALWIK